MPERSQEVRRIVSCSLAASALVDPFDHGLTRAEIVEVSGKHGFQPGEVNDAIDREHLDWGAERHPMNYSIASILLLENSELVPGRAVDFVIAQFVAQARQHGAARAQLDRNVVVSRGEALGMKASDIQRAVIFLRCADGLNEEGAILDGQRLLHLETQKYASMPPRDDQHVALVRKLLPTVADCMSRRAEGVPKFTDPIREFGTRIGKLGHPNIVLWWDQVSGELLRTDHNAHVTGLVLCAALGEAALTMLQKHASTTGMSMTGKLHPTDPTQWKFPDLINSAKLGQNAVLDGKLGDRCVALNEARKRIHLAQFLSATPGTVDIKAEEAREARRTLDDLLRAILAWLDRNPVA